MLGYNKMTGYNIARYNADGSEIAAADSVTLADGTVAKDSRKSRAELITFSETIAKQQNKSVSDTMRIQAWLRLKKDQANLWSD